MWRVKDDEFGSHSTYLQVGSWTMDDSPLYKSRWVDQLISDTLDWHSKRVDIPTQMNIIDLLMSIYAVSECFSAGFSNSTEYRFDLIRLLNPKSKHSQLPPSSPNMHFYSFTELYSYSLHSCFSFSISHLPPVVTSWPPTEWRPLLLHNSMYDINFLWRFQFPPP